MLQPRRIGLALSGGGARAMAFHLGCLRALYDRGILPQVEVVSAVSGGAVIGAMYAYSHDAFTDFDARAVKILRQGLLGSLIRHGLISRRLPESLVTDLVAGTAAFGADIIRAVSAGARRLLPSDIRSEPQACCNLYPPLRRWVSRTTAFEDTLEELLFTDTLLTSKRRDDVHVVLNACELRTGTAFRFGSRESACWRFGKLQNNDIPVSMAVAASAAYPALLPAIDRYFAFVDNKGNSRRSRVILTDGGVYDNLGVSCLEPDRSEQFNSNVFTPDYIICCDAGPGQFSTQVVPYWWPTRMKRSFETVFRKSLNASYKRMHLLRESGALKGFVLAYLGQQDQALPYIPSDFVHREDVMNYPTDFSTMTTLDIDRLSKRGEQLTRLLVSHYCPEL